jgi:chemotaxis protein MotB
MKRQKHVGHVSHERWLVSYADFITLLFAFFVVLFSASQADIRKVAEVEYSIHSAFQNMGVFSGSTSLPNQEKVPGPVPNPTALLEETADLSPQEMADLNKMKAQMDTLLADEISHNTVSVQVGRDGLIISLRAAGFFESASATPIPASMPTLNAIGAALATTPYSVRIEGHTDNVPIHDSKFASNWELSTARATELTRLFIEDCHMAPASLSAAGYAEYHPVASNDTAEGRNRNRRVDIIVLPVRGHHEELWMQRGSDSHDLAGRSPSNGAHRDTALSAHASTQAQTAASSNRARPPAAAVVPTLQAGAPSAGNDRQHLIGALYALQSAVQKHAQK